MVHDIQQKLDAELKLPTGYFITYGGTFQNLQEAKSRLMLAVPVALIIRVTLAVLYDEPLEPAEIVSGDAKR